MLQVHNEVHIGVTLIHIHICGYVDIIVFDKPMWLHRPNDILYKYGVKFNILYFPIFLSNILNL
jgi:hypothetical protein